MAPEADENPQRTLDRRNILRAAAVGLGAVAVSATELAGTAQAATTPSKASLLAKAKKPVTKTPVTTAAASTSTAKASTTTTTTVTTAAATTAPRLANGLDAATVHLLKRTTFGLTPELVAEVKTMGAAAWLNQQLSPASIVDTDCDNVLKRFPLYNATPQTLVATLENGAWDGMFDVIRATMARNLWSKRQLFEVMVEFWSNHLNVTTPSSDVWAGRPWEDMNVTRKHALGRFEDMLLASAKSPSMGFYLNNFDSTGTNPNENYARELLELHTVGVDAGYTHDDIVNAARALTGHYYWAPWNGGDSSNNGTWRYVPSRHYVGPVRVMGWSHANSTAAGGPDVTDSLVRYLAKHPATAKRIATKLAIRFVSDTPPQSLINTLAAVYLTNDTQIVPVLRALFASTEFAASVGQKFRRPYEDMVASLRVCGAKPDTANASVDGMNTLAWFADTMGHAPMGWETPDGFPDTADRWTGGGTTLFRWNMHVGVAQQWTMPGISYPNLYARLVPSTVKTRGALVDALFDSLLPGITVTAAHRSSLIKFLGGDGNISASTGEAAWLFPMLVALVLDTPYWSQR